MTNGINKHVHQEVIINNLPSLYFFFPGVKENNDDENLQYDVDDDDDDVSESMQRTLQVPSNSFLTRKFFI